MKRKTMLMLIYRFSNILSVSMQLSWLQNLFKTTKMNIYYKGIYDYITLKLVESFNI